MRNGPPITDTIIDAGISIGAIIVRPNVSATKISKAPDNAENGISTLWSVPTNDRPICGISKPTKVNMPAIAVVTDASKTARKEITIRARFTLKPKFRNV